MCRICRKAEIPALYQEPAYRQYAMTGKKSPPGFSLVMRTQKRYNKRKMLELQ